MSFLLPFAHPPKLLGDSGYATLELRTSTKNPFRLSHTHPQRKPSPQDSALWAEASWRQPCLLTTMELYGLSAFLPANKGRMET